MTRKRTRRKHYALVNPITYAIEGAAIASQSALDKLRLIELAAIDAFARGHATVQDWHSMTQMLNLAETMAGMGIGRQEVMPACRAAQAHLIEATQRYERTGRMGTTGPGLQALRDLYEYHDLQRVSVARSDYEKAIQMVTNRIRSKAPEVIEL